MYLNANTMILMYKTKYYDVLNIFISPNMVV